LKKQSKKVYGALTVCASTVHLYLLEELHVALADGAAKLSDRIKIDRQEECDEETVSLYLDGFNEKFFVDVLGHTKIWKSFKKIA